MSISCSVLAVDSNQSTRSLLISTENENILFDAGEGIQRLCVEHKVKLSKLAKVFFTSITPDLVGGLPGLCLSTAESGRSSLDVYGPPKLRNFWDSCRTFCERSSMVLNIAEKTTSPIACRQLEVHAFPLGDTRNFYICETEELPGKFNLQKAMKLNIPKGPLYSKLKAGHSVTLEDGTVVHPVQVLEQSETPQLLAVICDLHLSPECERQAMYLNDCWKR
jgi:ribonuclease Z